MNNLGQNTKTWKKWWKNLNPIKEIQKWDYYGLRPWILKYVPRNDKVLEAGCGLGRWVFYLSKLGINIEGIDFSKSTINYLDAWKEKNNFKVNINVGDVCKLPYKSNSLSGYISLGVVEHFIEGPKKPLDEAFRVLRPGGIAIITTPSISWYVFYKKKLKRIKNFVKFILRKKISKTNFFQYEYSPKQLRKHVEKSGFYVSRSSGADIMYTFNELGNFKGENIRPGTFGYFISHLLEKTYFNFLGAQSVTISIKIEDIMYCFLCNQLNCDYSSIKKYDVPICKLCSKNNNNSKFYLRNKPVTYHKKYIINPEIIKKIKLKCTFCNNNYYSDIIFEKFGFYKDICIDCLRDKDNNIRISNLFLQPIWRDRDKI